MRFLPRFLWIVSILSVPLLLRGQEAQTPARAEVIARLAYDTSAVTQRGDLSHVCLSIMRDGEYQIIRSTNEEPTQYLRGQMQKNQFQELKSLLSSKEFRSQTGTRGGLIRQDSESFRAEMPIQLSRLKKRADGTYIAPIPEPWRLEWLNADDAAPFPDSISKVVNWLRGFEPKDSKGFSYAEFPDVCPSLGFRRVQPTVAANGQR